MNGLAIVNTHGGGGGEGVSLTLNRWLQPRVVVLRNGLMNVKFTMSSKLFLQRSNANLEQRDRHTLHKTIYMKALRCVPSLFQSATNNTGYSPFRNVVLAQTQRLVCLEQISLPNSKKAIPNSVVIFSTDIDTRRCNTYKPGQTLVCITKRRTTRGADAGLEQH